MNFSSYHCALGFHTQTLVSLQPLFASQYSIWFLETFIKFILGTANPTIHFEVLLYYSQILRSKKKQHFPVKVFSIIGRKNGKRILYKFICDNKGCQNKTCILSVVKFILFYYILQKHLLLTFDLQHTSHNTLKKII